MDEKPNEDVDIKALTNAIICVGIALSAACLAIIAVNLYRANQAAKRQNAGNYAGFGANGVSPAPDLPVSESYAEDAGAA